MAAAVTTRDPPGRVGRPMPGEATPVSRETARDMTGSTFTELALRRRGGLLRRRSADADRHRLSLGWLSFAATVLLPVALAAVYYFLIAADQYATEFRFALRSAEPSMRSEAGGLLPADVTMAPVAADSFIVVQYIRSRAMVDDLGRTLDLRQIFSTRTADWPARLHLPVSVEQLVEYWKRQVDAYFDTSNGTVVVKVSSFTRDDSFRLAQGILALSEELVNRLSARARQTALSDSEAEVTQAEERLNAALARLREFRDRQGVIDPNKTAGASEALADRLRDALVRGRAELSTLQQYMREDAPPVELLETNIKSLEEQQRAVESGITETTKTQAQALSRVLGRYDELEGERHFAENSYQHALEALDRSRLNAGRQQVYLADFVPPRMPEEALYPRRGRAVLTVFLVAFALWGIGGLTARSIRDHL
jgi:capsular polysaccharide transport system permease protein